MKYVVDWRGQFLPGRMCGESWFPLWICFGQSVNSFPGSVEVVHQIHIEVQRSNHLRTHRRTSQALQPLKQVEGTHV